MDTHLDAEHRATDFDELARSVEQRAAHLRTSARSALVRHRARNRGDRGPRSRAPSDAVAPRTRTQEQSQIDHEARHCARRMAQDAVLTSSAH